MINTGQAELSEMIDFIRSLGIKVNTGTKARGHQGFFMYGRIDLSSALSDERKKEVLAHEFAHFIHSNIEKDVIRSHGSLKVLFKTEDTGTIEKELLEVTRYIDKNSALLKLHSMRQYAIQNVKALDKKIKEKYPEFKRSYPFKPFDSKLRKTDAKYLMKYDRVKVKTPFLRQTKLYTIDTFLSDFSQFDEIFKTYLLLKSHQRKMKRISGRINRLKRYYCRPSELFARFVEALYTDEDNTVRLAPKAFSRFYYLLEDGYYGELKTFFDRFTA